MDRNPANASLDLEPPARPGMPAPDVSVEAISKFAYELWQQRGCPNDSPDEDWFHAEQELRASTGGGSSE